MNKYIHTTPKPLSPNRFRRPINSHKATTNFLDHKLLSNTQKTQMRVYNKPIKLVIPNQCSSKSILCQSFTKTPNSPRLSSTTNVSPFNRGLLNRDM